MQHPGGQGGFQPGHHVEDGIHRFGYGKRPLLAEPVLEGTSPGDLHGNHRQTLDFLTAEHVETVGMVHARSKAAFTEKPAPQIRRIHLLSKHFQGYATARGPLLSFVHRAHAAATQQPKQLVLAKLTGECGWPGKRQLFARRHREGRPPAVDCLQGAGQEAGGTEILPRRCRNHGSAARTSALFGSAHGPVSSSGFIHFLRKKSRSRAAGGHYCARRTVTR